MASSSQLQRIDDGAGSLLNYTDLVLQHVSGKQREELLQIIRQQMLEYARLNADVQQAAEALREVKDEAVSAISSGRETDLTQLDTLVRQRTEQKMAAIGDVTGYERYKELLEREQAAGSAACAATGDEELMMTETHMVTRDPWSQQEIQQPYRNSRCGHLYDRSSLESVLQKKARKPTCPYLGCNNKTPLRWEDLTEDSVAKKAMEKARKTQTQAM